MRCEKHPFKSHFDGKCVKALMPFHSFAQPDLFLNAIAGFILGPVNEVIPMINGFTSDIKDIAGQIKCRLCLRNSYL